MALRPGSEERLGVFRGAGLRNLDLQDAAGESSKGNEKDVTGHWRERVLVTWWQKA